MPPAPAHPAALAAVPSAEEARALVARARQQRLALIDYGRAYADLGHPPPPDERCIRYELVAPDNLADGVVEHYQRDLTVRLHGGARFGDVQRRLAEHDQFLPIDADDDLTISEIVQHNVSGPLRTGYGTVRDLLLGLTFIDGVGREVRAGGRTVKNVAGYDLSRFLVGSLGQLGIVTEATLRAYALPARVMAVDLATDDAARVDSLLPDWLSSDAAPGQMLLSRADDRWRLRIAYHGKTSANLNQFRSLQTLIDRVPELRITGSGDYAPAHDAVQRAAHRAWQRSAAALVRIVVPPACTGAMAQSIADWARARRLALAINALPSHGRVVVGGPLDHDDARRLDAFADEMIRLSPCASGLRVWIRRPVPADEPAPFAPVPAEMPALLQIKQALDPDDLLNPGRLIPTFDPAPAAVAVPPL